MGGQSDWENYRETIGAQVFSPAALSSSNQTAALRIHRVTCCCGLYYQPFSSPQLSFCFQRFAIRCAATGSQIPCSTNEINAISRGARLPLRIWHLYHLFQVSCDWLARFSVYQWRPLWLRSSFIFLDMDGQDTFDFPPKTDSVELTARAVSLFVFIAEVALRVCSWSIILTTLLTYATDETVILLREVTRWSSLKVMMHLVNHMGQYPLGAGPSRVDSLISEHEDNPNVDAEELLPSVFNSPNLQVCLLLK